MKKNLVIILAGGSGSRFTEKLPKQFFTIKGRFILAHTIDKFKTHPLIHDIFVVTNSEYYKLSDEIVRTADCDKGLKLLIGGATRQDSSRIGVMAADPGEYENVLIHDAARPFVSQTIIDDIIEALNRFSAVNTAIPCADTIVEVDGDNLIKHVPDRGVLRRVQTPQAFKPPLIRKAHRLAVENGINNATDDCSLVLKFKLAPVYVVDGSEENIKITYPLDLQIARQMMGDKSL
jgi:2-C-methyl-D-erythritol 4-phosphate cytidylyltransferase